MSTATNHAFVDESPVNGLCDTCGSSVQFHAMPTARHTPTPWKWACDSYGKVRHSRLYDCVYAGNGSADRPLVTVASRIKNNADARVIVKAVNAHEKLVSALKTRRTSANLDFAIAMTIENASTALAEVQDGD